MLSAHSRDQLCSGRAWSRIVESWGVELEPGILVGQVTTPDHSDLSSEASAASALARELLRPTWARVQRIPLIRREIRESLSERALDILFASSELIVEGDRDLDRRFAEANRAYATVMTTISLENSAQLLRDPPDAATAERVVELMRGSPAVRGRLIELARPELAALLGAEPHSLRIELMPVVRREDTRILIDGDAVVSLRAQSVAKVAGGEGQ